jgi:broad specificity phosphatase PhoE
MSQIYVVRHGQSTWNAERRWTGHGDPPLSEVGRAQARDACETLKRHRFDRVCSSTLVRAIESATIIASALGLPQRDPMCDFNERFAGPMSGMTSTEIERRWPGLLDEWRSGSPPAIPGGEPWQAFVDRVQVGLRNLRLFPGRVLLVSHMGVQRAIEHALGRSPRWYGNLEGLWVNSEGSA